MGTRSAAEQQSSLLLQLPSEVRYTILDFLRDAEDVTPVMHSCKQLRYDVFGRLPGGNMIDYGLYMHSKYEKMSHHSVPGLAQAISETLTIGMVNILAEPSYSSGHTLRFQITWSYRNYTSLDLSAREHTTSWTVRDHRSPLARLACDLWDLARQNDPSKPADLVGIDDPRPPRLQITFCAPPVGQHSFTSLMILRTKVLDIIQILQKLRPAEGPFHAFRANQPRPLDQFQLVFAIPPGANQHRRSFWKLRLQGPSSQDLLFIQPLRAQKDTGSPFPYFYELLMCPLFEASGWKFGTPRFDKPLSPKRTSAAVWLTFPRQLDSGLDLPNKTYEYKRWNFLDQPCSAFQSPYRLERIFLATFLEPVERQTQYFNQKLGLILRRCRGPGVVQLADYLRSTINGAGARGDADSCKWKGVFHTLEAAFPKYPHDVYLTSHMRPSLQDCAARVLLGIVESVREKVEKISASRWPKVRDSLFESLGGVESIDAVLGVHRRE
jgi:hypothetical protein